MNEKKDNNYNINIYNISYGLQEDLGKKLENNIEVISGKKGINKLFVDSSDVSAEESHIKYYEHFLKSIKGESNNDVHTKSRNTSPVNRIKKVPTSHKKNFYQKEFKKRLMEHNDSNINENENLLCLQPNKEILLENEHSNQTDSSHKNYHSHIFEQNNLIKHRLNSSSKIFEEDEEHNKEKDTTPTIKYSINEISKFANNINYYNHDSSTPKSDKHFSKYKKAQKRHSTFLINEDKKEKNEKKRKKSSIFFEENINKSYNNISNNNIIENEKNKSKKSLKLKKNESSKKSLQVVTPIVGVNDKTYNNNFVSTINTSNVNTLKIENKKKYFLCCIPIS